MMKQLKLIWMLFVMKLERSMAFRFSFFNAFLVDGSMFILQLVGFQAIYANVDSIGGWGRGETLLFVGTFAVVNALNMVLFFFGLNSLDTKIQTGDLDMYLTKPMNPLLRVSFENIDMGSVPLLAFSALIVVYAAAQLPAPPSAGRVALYIILTLLMTLLWYDMMLLIRCIPFFVISAATAGRLEMSVLDMAMKIPGPAFRGAFKMIFMFVLPYGLIGTVPVEAMSGVLTWQGLCYAVAIVALFTWLSLAVFRLGVRSYKSCSS